MDTEHIVDALLEADVLVAEGEDAFTLSDSFIERLDHYRRCADELAVETELDAVLEDDATLPASERKRRDLLARYRAVDELVDDFDRDETVQVLPLVERFTDVPERTDGAPDSFTSVTGSQARSLVRTSERAVVYVWREDCEPCDIMVDELEEVFPEPPADVALLALYGPNYPAVVREFDVGGAPTTLFVRDGAVDARLHGAQYASVLESEVETLRNRD